MFKCYISGPNCCLAKTYTSKMDQKNTKAIAPTEVQVLEFFKFYSKEVKRPAMGLPLRICKKDECQFRQKNESHYHCKFCEFTRRGLQTERMLRHLISKHPWEVGVHTEPDPNSVENSRNRGISVLDHNYTVEQILPSNECMPHLEGNIPRNAHESIDMATENQENNPQQMLNAALLAQNNTNQPATQQPVGPADNLPLPSPMIDSISASIDENQTLTNDFIDRILADPMSDTIQAANLIDKGPDHPNTMTNGSFVILEGQMRRPPIDGTKICVIPKCTKYHEKLRTLVRYKHRGNWQHTVDWESTMLLLTFYKLDKVTDPFNKRICAFHWKEWYNFNYRLKKKMPKRIDANTQTETKYL